MTERRHKKAVRSARKCENLLDRQRGGNKNGYKWRKSVRCRLRRRSSKRKSFLTPIRNLTILYMDRYKRGQRTKIRGPLLFSANDEKQPHRRYNKKQKNKIVYKTGVVTDGIIVHYVYVFVKGWLTS